MDMEVVFPQNEWNCTSGFQRVGTRGWCKKQPDAGTDDGTLGGRYATGHCPIIIYVRWTHDGILARGIVQATGQTMRHV